MVECKRQKNQPLNLYTLRCVGINADDNFLPNNLLCYKYKNTQPVVSVINLFIKSLSSFMLCLQPSQSCCTEAALMDAQFLSAASSGSVKHGGLTSLCQELNLPREETKRKEK